MKTYFKSTFKTVVKSIWWKDPGYMGDIGDRKERSRTFLSKCQKFSRKTKDISE